MPDIPAPLDKISPTAERAEVNSEGKLVVRLSFKTREEREAAAERFRKLPGVTAENRTGQGGAINLKITGASIAEVREALDPAPMMLARQQATRQDGLRLLNELVENDKLIIEPRKDGGVRLTFTGDEKQQNHRALRALQGLLKLDIKAQPETGTTPAIIIDSAEGKALVEIEGLKLRLPAAEPIVAVPPRAAVTAPAEAEELARQARKEVTEQLKAADADKKLIGGLEDRKGKPVIEIEVPPEEAGKLRSNLRRMGLRDGVDFDNGYMDSQKTRIQINEAALPEILPEVKQGQELPRNYGEARPPRAATVTRASGISGAAEEGAGLNEGAKLRPTDDLAVREAQAKLIAQAAAAKRAASAAAPPPASPAPPAAAPAGLEVPSGLRAGDIMRAGARDGGYKTLIVPQVPNTSPERMQSILFGGEILDPRGGSTTLPKSTEALGASLVVRDIRVGEGRDTRFYLEVSTRVSLDQVELSAGNRDVITTVGKLIEMPSPSREPERFKDFIRYRDTMMAAVGGSPADHVHIMDMTVEKQRAGMKNEPLNHAKEVELERGQKPRIIAAVKAEQSSGPHESYSNGKYTSSPIREQTVGQLTEVLPNGQGLQGRVVEALARPAAAPEPVVARPAVKEESAKPRVAAPTLSPEQEAAQVKALRDRVTNRNYALENREGGRVIKIVIHPAERPAVEGMAQRFGERDIVAQVVQDKGVLYLELQAQNLRKVGLLDHTKVQLSELNTRLNGLPPVPVTEPSPALALRTPPPLPSRSGATPPPLPKRGEGPNFRAEYAVDPNSPNGYDRASLERGSQVAGPSITQESGQGDDLERANSGRKGREAQLREIRREIAARNEAQSTTTPELKQSPKASEPVKVTVEPESQKAPQATSTVSEGPGAPARGAARTGVQGTSIANVALGAQGNVRTFVNPEATVRDKVEAGVRVALDTAMLTAEGFNMPASASGLGTVGAIISLPHQYRGAANAYQELKQDWGKGGADAQYAATSASLHFTSAGAGTVSATAMTVVTVSQTAAYFGVSSSSSLVVAGAVAAPVVLAAGTVGAVAGVGISTDMVLRENQKYQEQLLALQSDTEKMHSPRAFASTPAMDGAKPSANNYKFLPQMLKKAGEAGLTSLTADQLNEAIGSGDAKKAGEALEEASRALMALQRRTGAPNVEAEKRVREDWETRAVLKSYFPGANEIAEAGARKRGEMTAEESLRAVEDDLRERRSRYMGTRAALVELGYNPDNGEKSQRPVMVRDRQDSDDRGGEVVRSLRVYAEEFIAAQRDLSPEESKRMVRAQEYMQDKARLQPGELQEKYAAAFKEDLQKLAEARKTDPEADKKYLEANVKLLKRFNGVERLERELAEKQEELKGMSAGAERKALEADIKSVQAARDLMFTRTLKDVGHLLPTSAGQMEVSTRAYAPEEWRKSVAAASDKAMEKLGGKEAAEKLERGDVQFIATLSKEKNIPPELLAAQWAQVKQAEIMTKADGGNQELQDNYQRQRLALLQLAADPNKDQTKPLDPKSRDAVLSQLASATLPVSNDAVVQQQQTNDFIQAREMLPKDGQERLMVLIKEQQDKAPTPLMAKKIGIAVELVEMWQDFKQRKIEADKALEARRARNEEDDRRQREASKKAYNEAIKARQDPIKKTNLEYKNSGGFARDVIEELKALQKMSPAEREGVLDANAKRNGIGEEKAVDDIMTKPTRENIMERARLAGVDVAQYFPSAAEAGVKGAPAASADADVVIEGEKVGSIAKRVASWVAKKLPGRDKEEKAIDVKVFDVDGDGKIDKKEAALVREAYKEIATIKDNPNAMKALEELQALAANSGIKLQDANPMSIQLAVVAGKGPEDKGMSK